MSTINLIVPNNETDHMNNIKTQDVKKKLDPTAAAMTTHETQTNNKQSATVFANNTFSFSD